MSGAGAPANRRGARAALCAGAALVGLAAVLAVAAREPVRRDSVVSSETVHLPSALPASAASVAEARPATVVAPHPAPPPLVAARARRDEGLVTSGPVHLDSPSFETGDGSDRVAEASGHAALDGAPREAGHTELPAAGRTGPPRAPALEMAAAPAGSGLEGWDGGGFWFGPNGLVRMREAEP